LGNLVAQGIGRTLAPGYLAGKAQRWNFGGLASYLLQSVRCRSNASRVLPRGSLAVRREALCSGFESPPAKKGRRMSSRLRRCCFDRWAGGVSVNCRPTNPSRSVPVGARSRFLGVQKRPRLGIRRTRKSSAAANPSLFQGSPLSALRSGAHSEAHPRSPTISPSPSTRSGDSLSRRAILPTQACPRI
jgi:hypothetical protein